MEIGQPVMYYTNIPVIEASGFADGKGEVSARISGGASFSRVRRRYVWEVVSFPLYSPILGENASRLRSH